MIRYDKYKDSGVDWLGSVPEHWSINRNKNVFREISKLSKNGDETLLTVSHITGVTPRSEKNVNMFFAETMEGYKICQEGDLVINTMWAWMGALGTSRYHGICSPAYNVYRNINGVDYSHQYFDYLFRTPNFVVEMTRLSKGIVESRLRLYPKDFFRIQTALPSLHEQTAIATYLDSKISTIDRKVSLLEQKTTHYQQLRKRLINETVCRGLNKNVKLKDSEIEWIGEIPEHWGVKRFKSFAQTIKGKNLEFFDEPFENSLPNLSLEFLRNDEVVFPTYCYSPSKSILVNEEDYIIVWDGAGVGEILNGKKGYLSSTIAKIVVNPKLVYPKYLFHLRDNIEYTLKQIPAGMGIPHLNPFVLNNFPCPSPPMDEQVAIANYLDEKTQKIDSIVSNIKTQIGTLKELRKTLINDVVTGKIKVSS